MPLGFDYKGYRIEFPVTEAQVFDGMTDEELASIDRDASMEALIERLKLSLENRLSNATIVVGVAADKFTQRRVVYPTNVLSDGRLQEVLDGVFNDIIVGVDGQRKWIIHLPTT